MKKFLIFLAVSISYLAINAKTLVVYYSYTNNVETIVNDLRTQIDADVIEIEPAEKGLDYAANNYAIGSAQIAAIRNNPDDASSYPAIDPVNVNLADYSTIIVAAPLWWSQMAAPLQTYLFENGKDMAGKNIGLIVSSASSGISGVVADAKRLIPDGKFLEPDLWIRSGQTSNSHALISQWLSDIHYNDISTGVAETVADEVLDYTVSPDGIRLSGKADSFSLYTLSGLRVSATSDTFLPTPGLGNGLYVLHYTAGNLRKSHKIRL